MPDEVLVLRAAAGSAVLAVIATLLALRPWGQPRRGLSSVGGAAGVGAGLLAGIWVLDLTPHYPPREDQDRLLLVLLPAAVLAEAAAGVLGRAGWAFRALVAAGAAPVVLHGSTYLADPGEWSPALTRQILAALAATLLAGWFAASRLATRVERASVPLSLALVCAGAGDVMVRSGCASGGLFGFPLAGGLIGVAAGVALTRRAAPRGAVGVGVVVLFALLVSGRFFASLTTWNAVLLFAAPLLGWVPELPWVRRLRPPVRGWLRVALTAVPVVAAVALARDQFNASLLPSDNAPARTFDYSPQDYEDFRK